MPITRSELKNVKALQTRKGRRQQGLFPAEGVRLLEEALRFERVPQTLYFSTSLISGRGREVVDRFATLGASVTSVPASDLTRMSSAQTSQGLLAVFSLPETDPTELRRVPLRNILVAEDLADPGNVGTLLRTALAFGFDMALLCGQCADPYSPKVVRSSVGAVFGLPVATALTTEALAFLKERQITILAAALTGTNDLASVLPVDPDAALAIAVGSEAIGLSEVFLDQADEVVKIDHLPRVESLNSAVAGAILMKECYDRRMRRKNE